MACAVLGLGLALARAEPAAGGPLVEAVESWLAAQPGVDLDHVDRVAASAMLREIDPLARLFATAEEAAPPRPAPVRVEVWSNRIAYAAVASVDGDGLGPICDGLVQAGAGELILDLRGAVGDDAGAAAAWVGALAGATGAVFVVRTEGDEGLLEAVASTAAPPARLVVLVDGETRGAAEAVCRVLRAHGAAVLGQATAGDPRMRDLRELGDGVCAFMARSRIHAMVGNVAEDGSAVVPDVVVRATVSHTNAVAEAGETDARARDERVASDAARETRVLANRLADDPPLLRALDLMLALRALGSEPERRR